MTSAVHIIPCLQLWGGRLVTTTCFRHPHHTGDLADTVQMLRRAGAEGLILLDVSASRRQVATGSTGHGKPDINLIASISDQCCMPVAYGGGVRSLEDIRDLIGCGVEKVLIGTRAVEDPAFVGRASDVFGSNCIVAAIDVRRLPDGGYAVCANGGITQSGLDPVSHARQMESMGSGAVFLNSVDRDGSLSGYDLRLIRAVARAVSIPVIACGGAGNVDDLIAAIHSGASGAAASSIFVFQGCRKASQVRYPAEARIEGILQGVPENAAAGGG